MRFTINKEENVVLNGQKTGFSSQLMKLYFDKLAPNFVKLKLYFECLATKIDIWRIEQCIS